MEYGRSSVGNFYRHLYRGKNEDAIMMSANSYSYNLTSKHINNCDDVPFLSVKFKLTCICYPYVVLLGYYKIYYQICIFCCLNRYGTKMRFLLSPGRSYPILLHYSGYPFMIQF